MLNQEQKNPDYMDFDIVGKRNEIKNPDKLSRFQNPKREERIIF